MSRMERATALKSTVSPRRASASDADALSRLAIESKASWGYDAAFVRKAEPALQVTPRYIETNAVYVLEQDAAAVGFFGFIESGGEADLNDFWIAPQFIGKGMGRHLWVHAVSVAGRHGYSAFTIHSDPNAAPFYRHMGAVVIGTRVAPETGRVLPLLSYKVEPDA